MANLIGKRPLTRGRILLAFLVAVIADGIQIALGPLGWTGADEAIDIVALSLLTFLMGFHPLFLPTFVLEFFPVVDMIPTWTGCVAIVVGLRKAQQGPPASTVPPEGKGDIIDV